MAKERKQALFINASRTGYGPDQVYATMTIDELIGALEDFKYQYGEESEVFLSHDNGYTYGGITWDDFFGAQYDDDRVYLEGADEYDARW